MSNILFPNSFCWLKLAWDLKVWLLWAAFTFQKQKSLRISHFCFHPWEMCRKDMDDIFIENTPTLSAKTFMNCHSPNSIKTVKNLLKSATFVSIISLGWYNSKRFVQETKICVSLFGSFFLLEPMSHGFRCSLFSNAPCGNFCFHWKFLIACWNFLYRTW